MTRREPLKVLRDRQPSERKRQPETPVNGYSKAWGAETGLLRFGVGWDMLLQ